jgi:hypothetical protein
MIIDSGYLSNLALVFENLSRDIISMTVPKSRNLSTVKRE